MKDAFIFILFNNINWPQLDETFSKFSFPNVVFNIHGQVFLPTNIFTFHHFSQISWNFIGMPLTFLWLLVFHILITFKSAEKNPLKGIFGPFKHQHLYKHFMVWHRLCNSLYWCTICSFSLFLLILVFGSSYVLRCWSSPSNNSTHTSYEDVDFAFQP